MQHPTGWFTSPSRRTEPQSSRFYEWFQVVYREILVEFADRSEVCWQDYDWEEKQCFSNIWQYPLVGVEPSRGNGNTGVRIEQWVNRQTNLFWVKGVHVVA
jgi:hypothetical protein